MTTQVFVNGGTYMDQVRLEALAPLFLETSQALSDAEELLSGYLCIGRWSPEVGGPTLGQDVLESIRIILGKLKRLEAERAGRQRESYDSARAVAEIERGL